ncbi:sigma-54-dependent transcriptional regulator [Sphingopyxis alaskensis]|jgi:two-component system nitrogen regulation response regulator NtrX|uniref:Two component, sigma54 specific, transcriptional regulator, Fis family n=1 Tax=Sphingopyxis alaskensis (strain DSM 13593 / LMG 18877 / RB2256) TaxID=317655 RepID=Q1GTN5_SPHAL|nr:sigma-54 dependent transcriptional regulator [Sphingopyxis alaskensis]ABF52987.1 two component, sigma54 specific, transcriptional regulator, Fis family [Sphingopyxis alaskensis RB2256]MCM3420125.1 sigma-54 dependent transcriptional regulator [Sphingopyxis alaskensis]
MALDILIVDDERDICELVAGVMEDEGYEARTASDSDSALEAIRQRRPSLALIDVWLQGSRLDGLGLVEAIKAFDPTLPIIVISGHGGLDTAVAAIRRGAFDFIEKPFEASRLLHLVARATENERLKFEYEQLREKAGPAEELTGNSAAINNVRATLKRVAGTGSRVLITGAPGVGKEVAARVLHGWSGRHNAPFRVISSARMDPETVELELFGSEAEDGSIRVGLLEQAHGGTLFLDEVADMPLTTQGKILRVLTDQSFTRVGGRTMIRVDVRIISGSARDLTVEIAEGRFREDLYYRLNVVPVHIPSLRERRDDIASLCDHFVRRYAADRRVPPPEISAEAMAALQAHDWPGNVRELRNVIERVMILAPSDRLGRIDADMLPAELVRGGADILPSSESITTIPLKEARENFEREYLRIQINRFSGNISRTASFIGMERSALHRKLKLLGLTESSDNESPA